MVTIVALPYVGANQVNANDVSTVGYVNSLSSLSIAQSVVDSLITAGFNGYVTKAYVDTRDALNATAAYVDSGDSTRLKLSAIGQPNGIIGLDPTAKVPVGQVGISTTQRFPAPFVSPGAYHSSQVNYGGTQVQVYTVSVPDPMFNSVANAPYKLMVFGSVDAASTVDGVQGPHIMVRQGSTTGPLIGVGSGPTGSYTAGQMSFFSSAGTYTVPTWAATVDRVVVGGGAPGSIGGSGFTVSTGDGGGAGNWNYDTLVVGSSLPLTTGFLSVSPGGANGGTSTVSGTGVSTLNGFGGVFNNGFGNPQGGWPGTIYYNGNYYVGGGQVGGLGAWGAYPGGGGNGGSYGAGFFGQLGNPGGQGAAGAVWLFAAPANNTQPRFPVPVTPVPLNSQPSLTGSTTLYVMLSAIGGSSYNVSTTRPSLWVTPIPA